MKKISPILGLLFAGGIWLTLSLPGLATSLCDSWIECNEVKQPLSLKIVVLLSGLGLVGLELWWFLGDKNNS